MKKKVVRHDIALPEVLHPQVRAEIRRARDGRARYVFIAQGSTVEHRSHDAAVREIHR